MKKWWKSKTVWFNVVTIAVGVAGQLLGVVKSETATVALTLVVGLGNVALRFITNTGISMGSAEPDTPLVK